MDSKIYEIGGRRYVQRPIVLGQLNILLPEISGIAIDAEMDVVVLIRELGERLPAVLAAVLVEESEKDVRVAMQPGVREARAEDLAWSVDAQAALEVVTDFFDVNPISSIGAKIRGAIANVSANLPKTASNRSCSTSPGETSQSGSSSSGEPGQKTPSPGLN